MAESVILETPWENRFWLIDSITDTRYRSEDSDNEPEWCVKWASPYPPSWRKLGNLTGCGPELLRFELARLSASKVSKLEYYHITGSDSVIVVWKENVSAEIIRLEQFVIDHLKNVLPSMDGEGVEGDLFAVPRDSTIREELEQICPALASNLGMELESKEFPIDQIPQTTEIGLTPLIQHLLINGPSSLYPFLLTCLATGMEALSLPFKCKIEHDNNAYSVVVLDPNSNNRGIVCSIGLKQAVSSSWESLNLRDIAETLLYAKYLLQSGQAKCLVTVLTDFFKSWHIFSFEYIDETLVLLDYYHFINTGEIANIYIFIYHLLSFLSKLE